MGLATDPVEGGSCSAYDYTCGDPLNGLDLNVTAVSGICGDVEFVGVYGGEFGGCFVTDDEGTSAIIWWAGFAVGADLGASFGYFYSNAPTVNDLAGWSACGSVNIPTPVAIGPSFGGVGTGSSAGVSIGTYYSNAPTVKDVLGRSSCIGAGYAFGDVQTCFLVGLDDRKYFSTYTGVGFRQPLTGQVTAATTRKVPWLLRGPAKRFIRILTGPLSPPYPTGS